MNPVIKNLKDTLFAESVLGIDDANVSQWTFCESIASLGPEFYRKIIPSHMILNMEYSLLGQRIRANFSGEKLASIEQTKEQLIAAIFLAELLEHVYQNYLIVPREVARLRTQQQLYCALLQEIGGTLPKGWAPKEKVSVGFSFTQQVHQGTLQTNLYRLFFVRSKRVLDLIAALSTGADWYHYIINNLDRYTAPFLPHLACFFYAPRLVINLGLLIKHLVPGFWMGQKEADLGFGIRLQGQALRRWFELGNDLAWVGVGIANCFILTGSLAPVAAYLAIAFFGFDVAMAAARAYIEINRLYNMRAQYQTLLDNSDDKGEIEEHIKLINNQIDFLMLRFGSHVATTTVIFLAMCCAAPMFAASTVIPLVGAVSLVAICLINFALVPIIEHYRPKDIVEVPIEGIKKLGFFAKCPEPRSISPIAGKDWVDDDEHHLEEHPTF